MKDLGKLILVLAIGVAIGYFLLPREKEIIKETVTVEIEVPAKVGEFEPIEDPTPITITNTEYVVDEELIDEYKKANDSLKAELFKNAVVVREYEETFEDSVQTIKVKAKVTGELNKLSASYVTKPFTVKKDTVVEFKVPANKKSISLYGEVGMPTIQNLDGTPVLKFGFDIINKKNFNWGLSYDTDKRVWVKLGKTFKF